MARDFEPKGEQRDVFGEGNASEKIREIIGLKLESQSLL